ELAAFYVKTAEFPAGFLTQYPRSMVTGEALHQNLATGFPIGKRFKSAPVVRVADASPVHLGHHARADGRWRIYAFADAPTVSGARPLAAGAGGSRPARASPFVPFPPPGPRATLFDAKVVSPAPHDQVDIGQVPPLFLPRSGPFGLIDYEKVYAIDPEQDFF